MTQQRPEVLAYHQPPPAGESAQWWWAVRAMPIAGSTLILIGSLGSIVVPKVTGVASFRALLFWLACAGVVPCLIGLAMSIAALFTRDLSTRHAIVGCVLAVGLPIVALFLLLGVLFIGLIVWSAFT